MQELHNYSVTYLDPCGTVCVAPIRARNDVDAAAQAVGTCEALRAVALSSTATERESEARAFVALQVFADEREGRVIWTNALFDELYRSSGAGRGS